MHEYTRTRSFSSLYSFKSEHMYNYLMNGWGFRELCVLNAAS